MLTEEINEEVIDFGVLLSGHKPERTEKQGAERRAVGGMRHPRFSLDKVPGHLELGRTIRHRLDKFLDDNPDLEHRIVAALGTKLQTTPPALDGPRLLDARKISADIVDTKDIDPVQTDEINGTIRPGLLHAWALKAGDPGAPAAKWLADGAPAGIEVEFPDLNIFPGIYDEDPEDFDQLATDCGTFTNYSGVDESQEACDEILKFAAPEMKGFWSSSTRRRSARITSARTRCFRSSRSSRRRRTARSRAEY